jgi:predicted MFS family arabinose efflux permease
MATLGLIIHLTLSESFAHDSHKSSQSFFTVIIKRKILFVGLLSFLFGFGLAASGNFVSPFAKEQEIVFISLYCIAYSFATVLTRLLRGRLADRIGEDRIMPYALALTGGGLLILMFLGGDIILVLSCLM